MGQNVTKRKTPDAGRTFQSVRGRQRRYANFHKMSICYPKTFFKKMAVFFFDMSFPSKSVLSFNFLGRSDFSKTFSETFFRYLAQEPYAAVQDGEGNNEARQYLK